MNLPLHIARRYLFSKKSNNAINLISMVSVLGVSAATLAMVCVLSAFNGFQDLIGSLYRNFDPDLKIEAVEGRTFDVGSEAFDRIRAHPGVAVFSESLEGNVLARYKNSQTSARLKGVSQDFDSLAHIGQCIYHGHFALEEDGFTYATLGNGLSSTLNTGYSFIDPIILYAPKRKSAVNMANPSTSLRSRAILLTATFGIGQPEYDDCYIIVPIDFARDLLEYDSLEVTSVEIRVREGYRTASVKRDLKAVLGEGFKVLDLQEQKADFYRINRMEKWVTYLMLCFILIVALCNVIGSLSMLVIEKKSDSQTLEHLGADRVTVRRVFLYEGWLIAFLGALLGLFVGTVLCLLQQRFGWLKLGGGGFIVSAYPIRLRVSDLGLVLLTVLAVSLPAVWWPVRYIFGKDKC